MWNPASSPIMLFIFRYLLSFLISTSYVLPMSGFCFLSSYKKCWYRTLFPVFGLSLNYFCNVFIVLLDVSSPHVTL